MRHISVLSGQAAAKLAADLRDNELKASVNMLPYTAKVIVRCFTYPSYDRRLSAAGDDELV
jgi:hypothetical protein